MKRITVLKRKMKKKLTVRTLSFIMAAGLLFFVVPFVAIASGREDPEPGKKGDFRLLRDFYAVTQITLEENMETAPVVTAENSNAASYQWQAYSREREQYVDLSGKASQQMELTEALAKQYDYGNGRSYFRCLATDAEGSILISDVLTVVMPVAPTEASQTEETSATTSTIDIGEPTQPGETEPTEAVESTTAPTEETTAPTEETTAPTEETTAPTTAPTQPTDEDSDPPKGSLVIPDAEEDEDVPLRGMLLVPLRAVETTYTVNYYIQKPEYTGTDDNAADYVLYKTESVTANVGDAVDLTSNMPGTSFDAYLTRHATLGNATGTVAADGASVFNVYFIRETFKFKIAWSPSFWYPTDYFKLSTINGEVTVDGSHPYEFYAKFGESLIGLWPTDDMITQPPTGLYSVLLYIREDYSGGNVHHNDPFVYLDNATITKLRTHTENNATVFENLSFYFGVFNYSYVVNYNFETADGNWFVFSDKYQTNAIFNTPPDYEGFWFERSERISRYTRAFYYRRNQYKLKYNVNGGDLSPTEKNVRFEETLSASTYNLTPTKDANTFGGWYYDNSFTTAVNWDTDTMPMRDVDIYAKWIPDVAEYTLTVNKNNGTADDTFTVASGNMLSTAGITQPTRTGYDFEGWYTDAGFASGTKIADLSTYPMPENDLTIYANWTAKNYTLTVHKNNDDDPSTLTATVDYGTTLSTLSQLATPSRTGYTFGGWYTDAACTAGNEIPATMPDSNLTVYAKWTVNSHTLTVHKNNNDAPSTLTATVDYGTTLSTLSQLATPSRTGYNFVGWYTDEDCTVAMPDTMPDNDLTVYAKWTVNSHTLTVHKNNDDDPSTLTATVDYGTTLSTLSQLATPSRTGYTFGGWYTDEDCTVAMPDTMPDNDLAVYAKWRIKKYTVRFFEKESDTSTYCADLIVSHGDTIRGDNYKPTRDGFVLKGWAYKDSENVQHDFIMDETPVTQDLDLYGVWNELFTVTFDPANGSNKTKLTVENGEKVSSSAVTTPPVYEDHTFLGWFYEGADGTEQEFEFDATVITGDMTVTAHWRKNEVTLIIHNTGANNIFTVSKEGLSLKVFIPAGRNATVKHLPFGDYTVAPSSPILKNWDYRFNPVANQTFTASVSDFDIPIEKTFGSGESRNLNWLGSESYKTFRPSIGG